MPDRPPGEPAIDAYLDAVGRRLVGPRAPRRAILDELRDGLTEAAAAHHRRGVPAAEAVAAALREFGAPAALASGFAGELATFEPAAPPSPTWPRVR